MPLIAVTTSFSPAREAAPARAMLNNAYLAALRTAGGTPLLLTPGMDDAELDELLGLARGLMLTGGGDIGPAAYGEACHPLTVNVVAERDRLEFAAARCALDRALPVFAICRGMQVVNVALGGGLHQHIPDAFPASALQHSQTQAGCARSDLTHDVAVASGSLLASVTGREHLRVNSMHHQALCRLGDGLTVVGTAPDGVIEAVELPAHPAWFLGVQWHPEELAAEHPDASALFEAFAAACG